MKTEGERLEEETVISDVIFVHIVLAGVSLPTANIVSLILALPIPEVQFLNF